MEATARDENTIRARARAVAGAFAATLALGLVLTVAFEPDVQTADAAELVARESDARSFFIADYVFIALYAVLSPIAIWRYAAVAMPGPPWWILATVVLLPLAGLVDATENALLWSAAGSLSPDAVDGAHSLAIPKVALFVAGAVGSIAALVHAIRTLRSGA